MPRGWECDFFIDLVSGVSSPQSLSMLNTNLGLKRITSYWVCWEGTDSPKAGEVGDKIAYYK